MINPGKYQVEEIGNRGLTDEYKVIVYPDGIFNFYNLVQQGVDSRIVIQPNGRIPRQIIDELIFEGLCGNVGDKYHIYFTVQQGEEKEINRSFLTWEGELAKEITGPEILGE